MSCLVGEAYVTSSLAGTRHPVPTRHRTPRRLCAPFQRLEFKLTHESVSAAEEKRMREQKERMERTDRPNAVRASALSARLDVIKAESLELRAQIQEIDKQVGRVTCVHVQA